MTVSSTSNDAWGETMNSLAGLLHEMETMPLHVLSQLSNQPVLLLREAYDSFGLTQEQLAAALGISVSKLQRDMAGDRVLDEAVAERVLEIGQLMKLADEVFQDPQKRQSWLNRESYVLGNRRPVQLLSSAIGRELLRDQLNGLNYGDVA